MSDEIEAVCMCRCEADNCLVDKLEAELKESKEIIQNLRDIVGRTLVEDDDVEFLNGWKKGVRDYAIWKDGGQVVGCMQKPLHEVLEKGPCHDY